MVKRKTACKTTKVSKAKYKKCLLTAIRGTKIVSRKGAVKAFKHAAAKCNALITGVAPRKKSRKGGKKKRRVTDPFKMIRTPKRPVSRRKRGKGISTMRRARGSGSRVRFDDDSGWKSYSEPFL